MGTRNTKTIFPSSCHLTKKGLSLVIKCFLSVGRNQLITWSRVASDVPSVLRWCGHADSVCRECGTRRLSTVRVSSPVVLAFYARTQRILKSGTEVFRHEGVDNGIHTRIKIGHQRKSLSHVLQVSIVQLSNNSKCHQHVVYQRRCPTNGEQDDNSNQHLYNLKGRS